MDKVYLINTETMQWPVYEGDYRLANSNISFPQQLEPNPPYEWVYSSEPAAYDNNISRVEETTPIKQNNVWIQQWSIVNLDQQQIDKNIESSKQAIKFKAESLLRESDWVEYPSVTDKTKTPHLTNLNEWIDYRVALRFIVINPPSVLDQWPLKPTEVWS